MLGKVDIGVLVQCAQKVLTQVKRVVKKTYDILAFIGQGTIGGTTVTQWAARWHNGSCQRPAFDPEWILCAEFVCI